jgi:hypothetical protein
LKQSSPAGASRAFDGSLLEASERRVVFAPRWRLPSSWLLVLGALAIVGGPLLSLVWNPRSILPHFGLGVLLPGLTSLWCWFSMHRFALDGSAIVRRRGPLVVERSSPEEPDTRGPAPYRKGGAAATFSASCGGAALGPDPRRGLLQVRAYVGSRSALESESAMSPAVPTDGVREVMVAHVLVIGKKAWVASHAFCVTTTGKEWSPPGFDRAAAAIARAETEPPAIRYLDESEPQSSMVAQVRALIRVLALPPGQSERVPTIVWPGIANGLSAIPVLLFNAIGRLGIYVWVSMNASRFGPFGALKLGLGVGLAIFCVEAAAYATVLRLRFVAPIDALIATWLDESAS